MWRDDGTRSAVKQSYRRVTVLSHGIPSLLSFLSPSCQATGAGRDGMGGTWEVVPARPSLLCCESPVPRSWRGHSYYKLYYYTYHLQEEELVTTRIENKDYLMNITHTYYLPITKTLLVHNKGRVQHVEMGSNRVYTMRVRGEVNVRVHWFVS